MQVQLLNQSLTRTEPVVGSQLDLATREDIHQLENQLNESEVLINQLQQANSQLANLQTKIQTSINNLSADIQTKTGQLNNVQSNLTTDRHTTMTQPSVFSEHPDYRYFSRYNNNWTEQPSVYSEHPDYFSRYNNDPIK